MLIAKGRSLEEVDELFEAGIKAWKFRDYNTQGAGRLLTVIENGGKDAVSEKAGVQETEVC